jgi:M6 family metalloprotease-like protein
MMKKILLVITLALAITSLHAETVTGNTTWAILLCKASDQSAEPKAPSYYRNLFTYHNATTPTVWDYFWTVSNYKINLLNSTISSKWHTTSKTLVQLKSESREQKLKDCITAAGTDVAADASIYYGIIAIYNVNFGGSGDSGAVQKGPPGPFTNTLNGTTKRYAGLVIEPWASFPSMLTHEMAHGYGLEHAFATVGCGASSNFGEYCDFYDVMGVSWNGYEYHQPTYLTPNGTDWAGPGMNAFNLEKLGWIPSGRETTALGTTTITSLSASNATDMLVIKVPIDTDPTHYYTIEYRRKVKWDAGIPADAVLIHEVNSNPVPNHTLPLSYLISKSGRLDKDMGYKTGDSFKGTGGVVITVQAMDSIANTAAVNVSRPVGGSSGSVGGSTGGSVDICSTCGPGNKTPHPRPVFQ